MGKLTWFADWFDLIWFTFLLKTMGKKKSYLVQYIRMIPLLVEMYTEFVTHPSVFARSSLWRETGGVCPGCRGGSGNAARNIASNNARTCYPSRWYCTTSCNHLHNTSVHNIHCSRTKHSRVYSGNSSAPSHAARKRLIALPEKCGKATE